MNSLFDKIEVFLTRKKVNWLLTFYVNLRLLPFSQAKSLPIHIYGRWSLILKGKAIIKTPIKRGMIKIGTNRAGFTTAHKGRLSISNNAKIIFHGTARISQGCSITLGQDAVLEFDKNSRTGDNVKIICHKHIYIGKSSAIAWESQVTDFNFHFIEHTETLNISNIYKDIHIGNHCWVGNRTTIMPGTKLPDRTIITSNSLLNKDYVADGIESYSLIGGIPAKLIRKGYKRIYSSQNETFLKKYFKENDVDAISSLLLPENE